MSRNRLNFGPKKASAILDVGRIEPRLPTRPSIIPRLAIHDVTEFTVWNRTADEEKLRFLTGEIPSTCLGPSQKVEGGVATTITLRRDKTMRLVLRRRELGQDLSRSDLASVDVVSLHVELTDQTRGVVDASFLGCLKPGAMLINAGRGELVKEEAVVEALASGHLGGYGADVVAEAAENHRDPQHSALWRYVVAGSPMRPSGHANVVLTPHVGGHVAPDLIDTANVAIDGLLRELGVQGD